MELSGVSIGKLRIQRLVGHETWSIVRISKLSDKTKFYSPPSSEMHSWGGRKCAGAVQSEPVGRPHHPMVPPAGEQVAHDHAGRRGEKGEAVAGRDLVEQTRAGRPRSKRLAGLKGSVAQVAA
jgi:hypothetical protein